MAFAAVVDAAAVAVATAVATDDIAVAAAFRVPPAHQPLIRQSRRK